ncbi:diguanylate cyclase [Solwaraspora sp. WMMD791]|uniref:diguanylate cyclase domain-containing protein n=1 Tax=Solwaraspora sp. WMMD791 TaxID=3016086 RepID=UPI00249BD5F0|nr:diguanylate cyclase [Solwaraspora sp. WMMD791]WFE30293.1 diguanylate cyclase [Solwaraspora sp. WMMD791]
MSSKRFVDAKAITHHLSRNRVDVLVFAGPAKSIQSAAIAARDALGSKRVAIVAIGDECLPELIEQSGLPVDLQIETQTEIEECAARVAALARRSRLLFETSPDTGLPGHTWMIKRIASNIESSTDFALTYIDIDRLKSVVDTYGFARGGEFIKCLASSLQESAARIGSPTPIVSHIGGDDFLVLCAPSQVRTLLETAIIAFELAADALYDPVAQKRGYLEVNQRHRGWRDNISKAALVTVSAGVAVSDQRRRFTSVRDAIKRASEMEQVAKSQPGSFIAASSTITEISSPALSA